MAMPSPGASQASATSIATRAITSVRARIGAYLAGVYDGRVSAYYPSFPEEGELVRVHFIIGFVPGSDVLQFTGTSASQLQFTQVGGHVVICPRVHPRPFGRRATVPRSSRLSDGPRAVSSGESE